MSYFGPTSARPCPLCGHAKQQGRRYCEPCESKVRDGMTRDGYLTKTFERKRRPPGSKQILHTESDPAVENGVRAMEDS